MISNMLIISTHKLFLIIYSKSSTKNIVQQLYTLVIITQIKIYVKFCFGCSRMPKSSHRCHISEIACQFTEAPTVGVAKNYAQDLTLPPQLRHQWEQFKSFGQPHFHLKERSSNLIQVKCNEQTCMFCENHVANQDHLVQI